MSFRYCRVYSWPYHNNTQSLSESYFEKMVKNADILVSNLPCNFAIFLAYEKEEFPFAAIALDMDYHAVAHTEISRTLDNFKSKLDGPAPSSIENPGWFTAVDSDFKSQLIANGISVIDGDFYTGSGAPITESNGPRVIHVEPTDADVQARIAEILGSEDALLFDPGEDTKEEVNIEKNKTASSVTPTTSTPNTNDLDKTPASKSGTRHKKRKNLKSRLVGWSFIGAALCMFFIALQPVIKGFYSGEDNTEETEAYLASLQLYPNSDVKSLAHGYLYPGDTLSFYVGNKNNTPFKIAFTPLIVKGKNIPWHSSYKEDISKTHRTFVSITLAHDADLIGKQLSFKIITSNSEETTHFKVSNPVNFELQPKKTHHGQSEDSYEWWRLVLLLMGVILLAIGVEL